MAQALLGDEEFKILKERNTSLVFKEFEISYDGSSLFCDISTGSIRLYVPKEFRLDIFKRFHSLSHPGIKATIK